MGIPCFIELTSIVANNNDSVIQKQKSQVLVVIFCQTWTITDIVLNVEKLARPM